MRFLAFFLLLFSAIPAFAQDAAPPARAWALDPSSSTLSFRGRQMNSEFTGSFAKFTAQINFDPQNLAQSHIAVDVDTASFTSGDKDRDTTAATDQWFDVANYPSAHFESTAISKAWEGAVDNAYKAEGNLTIKNVTVPVALNFTLDIDDAATPPKAHAKGRAILDRSKFSLGMKDWADESVIANQVQVEFDVSAAGQ